MTASPSLARTNPLVRVIWGTKLLYIPMATSADGRAVARFTLTPGRRGAVLTSLDDPSVGVKIPDLANMLHVALVKHDGVLSVHTVDNHIIPVRRKGAGLQMLLPGDHNTNTTSGTDRVRLEVTPRQSANE